MKSEIIERLGKTEILLPSLIAEGLPANDRVKVRLERAAGRGPPRPRAQTAAFDLADECRAAGIDSDADAGAGQRREPAGRRRIAAPGLRDLGGAIWDDVDDMIRAVNAGDDARRRRGAGAALPRSSRAARSGRRKRLGIVKIAQAYRA